MANLILTEIWIYPIKSLGGIRVSKSKVLQKGLEHDRRWMLIDEENKFMTQREIPQMALFKCSLQQGKIRITFENEFIDLELNHPVGKSIPSNVWDDQVMVHEIDVKYNEWFSDKMQMKCRLVSFPEKNPRPVDERYAIHQEHVSLADAYPLLIAGESSLKDLNDRLELKILMNRFRPNLVFSGGNPYEEDEWKNFSIGMNRFAAVKPCARCVMITVNQDTGTKGIEPLATLSKYRRRDNKVLFGQNVLAIDHDEIKEGDEIILE